MEILHQVHYLNERTNSKLIFSWRWLCFDFVTQLPPVLIFNFYRPIMGGFLLALLLYFPSSPSSLDAMRRSVSCPRSISAQSPTSADNRPFSAQQVISVSRPTSTPRSHSLNRASSYVKHLPHSDDASSTSSQVVSHLLGLLCLQEALSSARIYVAKEISWGHQTESSLLSFFSSWAFGIWINHLC